MFDNHQSEISISYNGLAEAVVNILKFFGVLFASTFLVLSFWYIRAWIPSVVDGSYKEYVIWIDSLFTGIVPSSWFQAHLRLPFFDVFLRGVWFSYVFCLVFGSSFFYCTRNEPTRHFIAVFLTLSIGLLIHYMLPTQPPWMAVEGVERINGALFTNADKNLTAAMPSIHQAIVGLVGCTIWKTGFWGKFIAISYNLLMAFALVYLGEHFVIDSIAGILLSFFCWRAALFFPFANKKPPAYRNYN